MPKGDSVLVAASYQNTSGLKISCRKILQQRAPDTVRARCGEGVLECAHGVAGASCHTMYSNYLSAHRPLTPAVSSTTAAGCAPGPRHRQCPAWPSGSARAQPQQTCIKFKGQGQLSLSMLCVRRWRRLELKLHWYVEFPTSPVATLFSPLQLLASAQAQRVPAEVTGQGAIQVGRGRRAGQPQGPNTQQRQQKGDAQLRQLLVVRCCYC